MKLDIGRRRKENKSLRWKNKMDVARIINIVMKYDAAILKIFLV